MRTTADILGDFLATMDTTIRVQTVTDVDGLWRLVVGKHHLSKGTLHAIPGRIITDSAGAEYTIKSFLHDQWIEVEAETAPPTGLWTLPRLNYYPGTPREVNEELARSIESQMPIVWLLEVMQEKVSYQRNRNFIAPIMRLFILDSADYRNWIRENHMDEAIRPMRNYADRVIQNMIYTGKFSEPTIDPVFINHVNFGRSFTEFLNRDADSKKRVIFSEFTSGVEVRLEIPIRRECYD